LKASYAPSHFELGKVLLAKGKVDLSLNQFNKSIELAPKNSEYIMGVASALVEKKELDQALEMLLAVSKEEPKNPDLLFAVCNVYTKKGYFTAATGYCEKTLELKPGVYEAMNRLAWLYAKKQTKLAKALDLSSQTLKAFPKRPEYIDTLSEIYYVQGKSDEAIAKIKEALNLVPNDPYYKQQLWKFKNVKPKKPSA
jgi:tetratricopeptide (TPR) repeat protein